MEKLFLTILLLCASQFAFASICPASSQISISQNGTVKVLEPGWSVIPVQKITSDAKPVFLSVGSTHYEEGDGFICKYGRTKNEALYFALQSIDVFKKTHYSSSWVKYDNGVDRGCSAELTQCTW